MPPKISRPTVSARAGAQPWHRLIGGLVVLCVLSACGGGSAETASPAAASNAPAQTVGERLVTLQAQGALPTLDVSSTLAGPDANANGVRDDIDAFIAAGSDTTVQKSSQLQLARALQSATTVDVTNTSARAAVANALANAVVCVFNAYDATTASQAARRLQAFTANTLDRLRAYEKFNAAMTGSTTALPAAGACNA